MEVKNVGVIGAGQMGAGIAQVCAAIGKKVILCDIKQEFVDNGLKTINRNLERSVTKERIVQEDMDETLANIQTTLKLGDLSECDIIIEAIVENVDIKKNLFLDLGKSCKDDAILASNTSSIPIGILAEASGRPELVVGMHFMNPVPVMKLVEVIRAKSTSNSTFDTTFKLAADLNKVPVMKLGMSHPMGPLTLADFIGLDTCLAIMEVLHRDLDDDKYRPCPLLIEMVNDGKLGKKSGEGFYKY